MMQRYLFSLLVMGLSACSAQLGINPTSAKLMEQLAEHGTVAVSAENPFLASNQLLTREMEKSPDLKGFIEHQGLPTNITVEPGGNFSNTRLSLYYATTHERFDAIQTETSWIITGQEVKQQTMPLEGKTTSPIPFHSAPNLALSKTASAPEGSTSGDTPRARLQLHQASFKSFTAPEIRTKNTETDNHRDSGLAELSPHGDLVHYVVNPKERLEAIAQWYTGDATNTERLARMLGKKNLEVGDTVVIPRYMVKNNEIYNAP